MISPRVFSKVDELFDAALSRPVEERLRFVEEACKGDSELAARVGRPGEVLVEPPLPGAGGNPNYDVFPDGRFLGRHAAPGTSFDRLRLVLNWHEEPRELVPVAGRRT